MAVKPVPTGYNTITPYLVVNNGVKFVDYLKRAFDAREISRMVAPDGRLMHAEVMIGDSHVMIGEPMGDQKPMPTTLYLYTENVNEAFRQAVQAGGTSVMEPTNQFWGDRYGTVKDEWGNLWGIATHVEDVSKEEVEKRARMARRAG